MVPIYGNNGHNELSPEVDGYKKVAIETIPDNQFNTLEYTIKNPVTFIYSTVSPWDWYTSEALNQNNTLWGEGSIKSAYDPCPQGWKVPPINTWNDFTRTDDVFSPLTGTFPLYTKGIANEQGTLDDTHMTNGRLYAMLSWYPAAGTCGRGTGLVGNIGVTSRCWSINTEDKNSLDMSYSISFLHQVASDNRGAGSTLRCIQE